MTMKDVQALVRIEHPSLLHWVRKYRTCRPEESVPIRISAHLKVCYYLTIVWIKCIRIFDKVLTSLHQDNIRDDEKLPSFIFMVYLPLSYALEVVLPPVLGLPATSDALRFSHYANPILYAGQETKEYITIRGIGRRWIMKAKRQRLVCAFFPFTFLISQISPYQS